MEHATKGVAVRPEGRAVTESSARATRFDGRQALRGITEVERCYDCGREPVGTGVAVRRTDAGVVGFAGLASCGRVWLCPVCNARIMAERAMEIGAVLVWAWSQGLHVIWGSLTCRHYVTDSLASLLAIQRAAWDTVVSHRDWREQSVTKTVDHVHNAGCSAECERKRDTVLLPAKYHGRVGYIRAAELTVGSNGWHPHFHPMIFYRGTRKAAERFAATVTELWVRGVKDAGGDAQLHGSQQLKVLRSGVVFDELSGYVTKATYEHADKAALEVVWSQGKTGRRGRVKETVSHWSLLAAIARELGDEVDRWQELEGATKGHRMIAWSRGLRDFAGLGVEKTNEEIAAEEVGTKEDTVCFITGDGWRSVRDRPEVLALLLNCLEGQGWGALRLLLDAYDVEYVLPDVGITMPRPYSEVTHRL